jgi:predicted peptidase
LRIPFPCITILPKGYEHDTKKRWPVLLFLHGGGAQDLSQLPKLLAADDFRVILKKHPRPVIVLEPMLSVEDLRWSSSLIELLLEQTERKYRIDRDRIVLCGESSGGTAVWRVASEAPDLFAGAMPMSSSTRDARARSLVHVPIWAFQYKKDDAESIVEVTKAINAKGGSARLTTVPGNGHFVGWAAWGREDVWAWILGRRRQAH